MRGYGTFLKKELCESVRTYRLFILLTVFLLFGMANPVFAKITPDLLGSLMPEGMNLTIPTPSAIDSWTQFYKNMPMQMMLFYIVFGGIVSGELSRGTLINMLTKGLPRRSVMLAKFTLLSLMWLACYGLCFGVTYGYTLYLLPGNDLPAIGTAAVWMGLFGLMLNAALLLGGALSDKSYMALLVTAGVAGVCLIAHFIPAVSDLSPYRLCSDNMALLGGSVNAADGVGAMAVTLVLTACLLAASLAVFNKKAL